MTLLMLIVLAAPPHHAVPWGVIDGPFKMAYIRHDKGVEAVEIATGKTMWKSEGNERPLSVGGGLLLAWAVEKGKANAFRLIALYAATGKPDVVLAAGGCVHAVSLDGKHVAVLTGFETAGKPLTGKVFDGATGREIGSFIRERPVVSLEMAGPHVFALRQATGKMHGPATHYGRTLESIVWKTGKAAWSREGETRVELPLPK